MLVDMHLHESTCSSDSKMTLEEIVATARERGLDAVCITDHDSMGLRKRRSSIPGRPVFRSLWEWNIFLSGEILLHSASTASRTSGSRPRISWTRSMRPAAFVWRAIPSGIITAALRITCGRSRAFTGGGLKWQYRYGGQPEGAFHL